MAYGALLHCSQECPGCHFHLGKCQGRDQLLMFRLLQLQLSYLILAVFYFLYSQGVGCQVYIPCSCLPTEFTLGFCPFGCHLLEAIEDSSKSVYLSRACWGLVFTSLISIFYTTLEGCYEIHFL